MKSKLILPLFALAIIAGCTDSPDATIETDVLLEDEDSGIISLPDTMKLRPHIQWVEWSKEDVEKYVSYESEEGTMVVAPELAQDLIDETITESDVIIAHDRAWMTNFVEYTEDGTAFVSYREINPLELMYGKFTIVWFQDGSNQILPYGTRLEGDEHLANPRQAPTPKEIPIDEPRTEQQALSEPVPMGQIGGSYGSEVCSSDNGGGAFCAASQYTISRAQLDVEFDMNGEAYFDAYIPHISENYTCYGERETAGTWPFGTFEYCLEHVGLVATPTYTARTDFEFQAKGEGKYALPDSGDLANPNSDRIFGRVNMGTLPVEILLIGALFYGMEFSFSGQSTIRWDAEYTRGLKVGFEYFGTNRHPNYPAVANPGQNWFFYPGRGDAIEQSTGGVTATAEVGFEIKVYGGAGIKLAVAPTGTGQWARVGGPGVGLSLEFKVGRTSCASGGANATGCNDADFSDCGGATLDLVLAATLGLRFTAKFAGFEINRTLVAATAGVNWNLMTLRGVNNINCVAQKNYNQVRITAVDTDTPRGVGNYADILAIDWVKLDHRNPDTGVVQEIRADNAWGSGDIRDGDVRTCRDVFSNAEYVSEGGSIRVEFGGNWVGYGSQKFLPGDTVLISPHRGDFERDPNNPCSPGGTFELEVGDGSTFNKVLGSNGQPIRFLNNGTNTHTFTENDLR